MLSQKSLGQRLKHLREEAGFSQEQIAPMVGVKRPTLAQIELGNRKVVPHELKKYSEIFDVSIDFLLGEELQAKGKFSYDEKKFKQLLLYILEKCGAKYNVGKTVLFKLLYFSEFDFYEKYKKHISGILFVKLPMGPAPLGFDFVIHEMKKNKEIIEIVAPYGAYFQHRYIPNAPVQYKTFSGEEKKLIDEVIEKYSDYKATEISNLSHQDIPRLQSKDMQIIDYKLAFERKYPFSPVAREKRKQQTFIEIKASDVFSDLPNESDVYEKYRHM